MSHDVLTGQTALTDPYSIEEGPQIDSRAFQKMIELGIALSSETNGDRLLENILLGMKELTNADGGTIYLRAEENRLAFATMRNDTLGVAMGGTTGKPIPFPPLRMYREDGTENHNNVSTYVALTGRTIKIADAYVEESFDFSGTKAFDDKTGYRSKSFLTVPLKNNDNYVIGVIQLINARALDNVTVIPFGVDVVPLVEALSSLAAVALTNQQLIRAQRELFDAFIALMSEAIDAKSAYTGGHCQRVPELTEMLAAAACAETEGPFADFQLNDKQWYELRVAGQLHDVGKVITPVHIMDKATKLEKICDRIVEVKARFELLKRDAEIAYLSGPRSPSAEEALKAEIRQLDEEYAFVAEANIGGEFMADDKITLIKKIAERHVVIDGQSLPVLSEDEVLNLSIRRGTLNDDDRWIINKHINDTQAMLKRLPFPPHLKNVAEIAGNHHEKMDGTGYPNKLKKEEMSLTSRMMGIADIFEALTAPDRPYKKAKTLSESIKIMSFMSKDQHIDSELFELFLRSGVYKKYADRFLLQAQMDEVDIEPYLRDSRAFSANKESLATPGKAAE
jgi:HD-GYP domain-containing protein (c-di-GMP phosphodiesterase class II)